MKSLFLTHLLFVLIPFVKADDQNFKVGKIPFKFNLPAEVNTAEPV